MTLDFEAALVDWTARIARAKGIDPARLQEPQGLWYLLPRRAVTLSVLFRRPFGAAGVRPRRARDPHAFRRAPRSRPPSFEPVDRAEPDHPDRKS